MVSAASPELLRDIWGYTPHGEGRANSGYSGGASNREPAPLDRQRQFEDLLSGAGVQRGRNAAELHRCPWHDDREASLSIDWTAAVFFCHASGCVAHGGGGIVRLREVLGIPAAARNIESRVSIATGVNDLTPRRAPVVRSSIDVEAARLRLASGVYDVVGNFEKSRAIEECGQRFYPGVCSNGHQIAYPVTCRVQLCPSCGPWQLAVDWREKIASCPDSLRLLRLRPHAGLAGAGSLTAARKQLRHWRDSRHLTGLYGARYESGLKPVILLLLPTSTPAPAGGRAFDVEEMAAAVTPDEALQWLQDEYTLEVAEAWTTPDDLRVLLGDTKGRRRFQGFGASFKSASCSQSAEQQAEDPSSTANNLRKTPPSGGAGHGAGSHKVERRCPICDAPVQMYTFKVGSADVQKDAQGRWRWLGPPGRRAA